MNCDLVFEILTRGPFPTGEPTDASVELHLSRCHDCRRLAEALRPAVELFHETLLSEGEVDSLPGYYGALCEVEDFCATAVADPQLASNRTPSTHDRRPANPTWRLLPRVGQWAAGMLLGMAVCFALAVFVVQSSSRERVGKTPAAGFPSMLAGGRHNRDVGGLFESLQLPLACLTPRRDAALPREGAHSQHAADRLLCCTQCHSAAAPDRPQVSAVALLQREACAACHQLE